MENYDVQDEYGWVLLGVPWFIVGSDITDSNNLLDHVDYKENQETLIGRI